MLRVLEAKAAAGEVAIGVNLGGDAGSAGVRRSPGHMNIERLVRDAMRAPVMAPTGTYCVSSLPGDPRNAALLHVGTGRISTRG